MIKILNLIIIVLLSGCGTLENFSLEGRNTVLNDKLDYTEIKSEFGINYLKKYDLPNIVFQDAMTFGDKQSWNVSQELSKRINMPVARINIKTDYSSGNSELLSYESIHKAYMYLNNMAKQQNKKVLLILFMNADKQYIQTTKIAVFLKEKYENISIIAVGNEWSKKERLEKFNKSIKTGKHPFYEFLDNKSLIETIKKFR